MLPYFGTDLTSYGHYFWLLDGSKFIYQPLDFSVWPFNPEQIPERDAPKGEVKYVQIAGYSICAISGSCKDTRGGTKSVFWVKGEVEPADLKEMILAVPIF